MQCRLNLITVFWRSACRQQHCLLLQVALHPRVLLPALVHRLPQHLPGAHPARTGAGRLASWAGVGQLLPGGNHLCGHIPGGQQSQQPVRCCCQRPPTPDPCNHSGWSRSALPASRPQGAACSGRWVPAPCPPAASAAQTPMAQILSLRGPSAADQIFGVLGGGVPVVLHPFVGPSAPAVLSSNPPAGHCGLQQ